MHDEIEHKNSELTKLAAIGFWRRKIQIFMI